MFAQVLAVATFALATLSNAAALPKRAVTVDPGKVCASFSIYEVDMLTT